MLKVGFKKHFQRSLWLLSFVASAAAAQPTLSTSSLPSGTYGSAYNQTLTADTYPTEVNISLLTPVPGLTLVDNVGNTATLSGIPTAAGVYTITIEVRDPLDDSFTTTDLTLTIDQAPLIITANNDSRNYGYPDPTFTFSYSGFVLSDNAGVLNTPPSAATNATATSGVGSYTITPSGAADDNYSISYVNGTLTINPAPLTITADDKTRTYGASNPTLTASFTGFRNSETSSVLSQQPTLSTTAVGNSPVGSHPTITASGAAAANYSITYVSGQFNITKASLTVTPNNQSRPYGDLNPTLSLSFTGFQNGETVANLKAPLPTGTTTANNLSNVGAYSITVSAGAADDNYDYVFQTGTLTVTKALVTATADDKTKPYGDVLPIFTISYSGLKNGENASAITTPPTITTAATSASSVGSYDINLSGGSATNYNISTLVKGTLTVTKVDLTATADNKSKVYGAAVPPLTISYSGFVNSDNAGSITPPTISTLASTATHVGTTAITLSGGSATNYNLTLVNGTLTTTQATLTITADDKTRVYGAANPSLSVTYSGFLNGDTPSVFTTGLAVTTAANATSPVGPYAITPSAAVAADYSISFVPGTLTITKAPLTATAANKSMVYGSTVPTLTISYSGFLNSDGAGSITQPTITTSVTSATHVGTYAITLTGGSATNYSLTLVNGTMTVTQAPLTITADSYSRSYGSANPTLTVTYAGFLNGDTPSVFTTALSVTTTAALGSPAGTYPITPSAAVATDYSISFVAGTLTVTKVSLTITADAKTKVYGASVPPLTMSFSGFVNGDNAASISLPTITTAVTTATHVGTYSISLSGGSATNYVLTLVNGTMTVTQAPLTITANNQTRAYGSANPTLTVSYSGFLNGDTPSVLTTAVSISTSATLASPVGTYSITPSAALADDYSITFANGTLTVTKAPLTVTADNKTKVYGALVPTLTISYSGFVNGEDATSITVPTITSPVTNTTHIGTYSITLSGGSATNYTLTLVNGTMTVTKAPLTITADDKSRVYGGANPPLTVAYAGFVNGDTPSVFTTALSVSTPAVANSTVGTYAITPSAAVAGDYSITFVPGTLTVTKAGLTATADAKSKVYGAAVPTLTISYSGFVAGDNVSAISAPTISTTATAASHVGSYAITLAGGSATNYDLTLVNGTLTVTQATLTITADNQTRVYGASNPTLTVLYTGFVNGDTQTALTTPVSVNTTAVPTSTVGNYPIVPSSAVAPDYSITFVNGTLTITKAVLTATADDKFRTYGAANPPFTITYTGFISGESVANITPGTASAVTATPTASVGTYAIVPSGGSAVNYSFVYVNGTITISKATVTATANNATRLYGDANPTFGITYSGFLNGETSAVISTPPTASTPATIFSDVGTYSIDLVGGAATNYLFNYVSGIHTVNKATLNATAVNQTKVYGSANPTLTVTYSGFKNGEDANVLTNAATASTLATTFSNVGTYAITVSGAVANNYTFTYTSGTLTVTKATVLATAVDKTRTYGAANPTFTVAYTGLLGTDVPTDIATPPTMTTPAGATSSVGNYPINISGGSDENYAFTYAPGILTITKATLTAKPDNKTRAYGAANPTFTVTYTGFLNGESASVIDTAPAFSTIATVTSPVGTYNIDVQNAFDNNYDFAYTPGTLTITKASLTATANNQSKIYGAANPTLTITYTGFLNGDDVSVLDQLPVASTTATAASPVGSYSITLASATDNNYNYVLVAGTLTVTKATLTVTADDKTRVYNTPNPAFTLSYAGFVNGDDASKITPPTGTTVAVTSSPVGSYTINLAGGTSTNYTFVFVPGTLTIIKSTPVVTWSNPSAITYGTPLTAAQLNASANVPGSFVYTPAGGSILNAGTRTLSVDFTPTDQLNYNSVTGTTVTIVVNKATPVITWSNPSAISYGTPLSATQLSATSSVLGTFAYTPDFGTVLNAGSYTLRTDFTPADGANYNSVTNVQRPLTVNKAVPVVTWNNPAPIVYGTPLGATQLDATFSVPGTATYVPGPGTILPTGANQVIVVNFTPTDAANYSSVNGTQVLITVNKATPVITWSNPADITYGTTLTATQLNASSNVAGSLVYTPALGTLLSAGAAQSLSVTFTPSDPANYNGATRTVSINVNKANPTVTWANPAAITYGTALSATQLNATSPLLGSFVYSPASGTVLSAGVNQTLSTTFTPTDVANYNSIVVNRLITVNKANPVVTWSNPSAITYGTPLSGTQLNATANVPGQFDYTPVAGTVLSTGANQTLSVKFTPTDGVNYNVINATTVQITVNKATPVISWSTPLPIKILVPLTSTQLNATANVPGAFTYTPAAGSSFATEGTYTLHARFDPTDQTNYSNVLDTQVQIVVSSKDNPVITWVDPAPITYGTTLGATQQNATADVPGTFAYNPAPGTLLNAGNNQNISVTFTPTDGVNYNSVSKTVQITVSKKLLTATAANASRNYGASNPSFTINYSGFVGSETSAVLDTPPTTSCAAIASDPAGATFPIIPAGGVDNNYSFSYVNGTLTINKAALTATADAKSRTYGSSNPSFTISYTGFVNSDNATDITEPTASTSATLTSNAGTYPITLSGGSSSNYNITLQNGTLTVSQALLVVIANDASRTYGAANPSFTFQAIGFKNGDGVANITSPTLSTTATVTSGVGTYPINLTGGSATNYSFALFPGNLTVTKKSLTATADDKTRVYGQNNPSNSISYSGFVNGDGPASITPPTISGPAATQTSNAGTYPILLSGGSAANYDLVLVNGTLTVTKANLTATADNKSRVYGSANPTFTISYSGFLNGDNATNIVQPTATTTANATSDVGTYSITVVGGSSINYNIQPQTGILTVTKATLVARANDQNRRYGQANPTLTITYTSFLNGDSEGDITPPTISTTATTTSTVGNYPISLTGGAATNYSLTLQSGTLTVSKALLTAKADNKTKVYGTANPANSITYTGFVNGDDATDITPPIITGPAATSASPVGSYPITLSGGSGANYTFTTLDGGTLTITPAPLTATADNKTRIYGATNPSFTITYSGFVNGDTPSSITQPVATTAAVATSNVGSYPITLSGSTLNYAYTFVDGTLSVTKATVTATADSKTKVYGSDNPTFTITFSGFVNSESSSVIDVMPTVNTTATNASPVGTYPLTFSGGSDNNYNFVFNSGTLTVTKAPLTAKADNKSRSFGTANPALTISYTGFVNGDGPTSITQPIISTTATISSPFGNYPIVLTGGAASNYTLTLQQGTLSVVPTTLTVTANNQVRDYGSTNPTLTLSYSGFVNGQTAADLDVQPTASTTATSASNAGTYPITAAGAVDPNYTFVYVDGTLTVNKVTLTAKADSKTSTYGTIPTNTITYTGFVNGENPSVLDTPANAQSTATPTSPVGTYPITASGGVDNNYNLTYQSGILTIGKAPLTVTADNKSRITSLANPIFTVTYSGFMNGETASVLDQVPVATCAATQASAAGAYPIVVAGGVDGNYSFTYVNGTLTVIQDGPPAIANFTVETQEDTKFTFPLSLFELNYADDPGNHIAMVKVVTLPLNGTLFKGASTVAAGDVFLVSNGVLDDLSYLPNPNFFGTDAFTYNVSDGNFYSVNPATITLKVTAVNDAPVLSNVEANPVLYRPGDAAVKITTGLIINDIDNTNVFEATVAIGTNFANGDRLATTVTGTKIEATFNATTGELKLSGKETRANYETALRNVTFSTPVNSEAIISDKNITFVVRDSLAWSNTVMRTLSITEVFPELELVSAFTPNGDGVNDVWDIVNLHYYGAINISIFNQNGVRIFNCQTQDCTWDGTVNGKSLPAGPYPYIIDLDDGKRRYKGTVTILK